MTIKQILTGVRDWINNKFATKNYVDNQDESLNDSISDVANNLDGVDLRVQSIETALPQKQDKLVSGTNIKTVNSTSLLGSGNIAVQPTLVSGTNIKTVNNTSLLGSGNVAVQPTLVSGTNIKTIGGLPVLGSGDLFKQLQPTSVPPIKKWVVVPPAVSVCLSSLHDTLIVTTGANMTVTHVSGNGGYEAKVVSYQDETCLAVGEFDSVWEINVFPIHEVSESNFNKIAIVSDSDFTVLAPISVKSYQDKLVSGTNIKTINNASLLGSGNIDIQGGGDADMSALEGEDGYIANKVGGYKIEASSDDIRINYSGSFDDMDDPLMPSWDQLLSAGMPEHVKVLLKNDVRKLRTYFFDSQDTFLGNGWISYDFEFNSSGPIITGPNNLSFSYFELDATSDWEDPETGIPYAYIHYSPGIIRGEAEVKTNRVTSISSASTDFEYPSAKCVYDAIDDAQNVFIVTYGTTTYSNIQTAYTAGKIVVMPYRVSSYDRIFYLIENNIDAGFIYFYSYNPETKEIWYCSVNDSNTWSSFSSFVPEDHSKLVTSWQSTTDNTHYPSEKLVKDNLDGKQATLVSGSNIKTINAENILGSGDITVYYPGTYIGTGTGWGAGTTSGYLRSNYFQGEAPSKVGDLVYSTSTGCLHKITALHYDSGQSCYYADSVYYVTTFERTSRLVTSISSASTDAQYPSAKCVYDLVGDIETLLASI